jgi:hypothetical protein
VSSCETLEEISIRFNDPTQSRPELRVLAPTRNCLHEHDPPEITRWHTSTPTPGSATPAAGSPTPVTSLGRRHYDDLA